MLLASYSLEQFFRDFSLIGFPYFAWVVCLLWRPVDPKGKPRLPAAAQIVLPIGLALCCLMCFFGIPLMLLGYWLVPRERGTIPRPSTDLLAYTSCAFGISLMLTMVVFSMEGDGDYRAFEVIRLHRRIFLVFAAFALVGPVVAYAMSVRSRVVAKTPRDSFDEPFIG